MFGPGDIRITETDGRDLGPGTVRVDIGYTGICGSDVHEYKIGPVPIRGEDLGHRIPESDWDEYLPKPMGHEIVGTIAAVGEGVDKSRIGTDVALNLMLSCGECRYCQEGLQNLCTAVDGSAVSSPGFADSMIAPAKAAVPVPDSVSLRHAALTEPLSVSLHAVRRSPLQVGDSVAVFGAGPIGLGIIDVAQTAGAGRILVSEPRESRRDAARALGVDVVIDPREMNPVERISDATDGGVDVGFEAAGISTTFTQALRSTKYDGTVVVVSVFEEAASIHPNDIMQAERNVRGAFAYNGEFPTTLELLADGAFSPDSYITGTAPLTELDEAFQQLMDPESGHIKILVEP